MLFRYCVAVRVAWTSATGTALRDPTPPLGWARGRSEQASRGGEGLENVRDDNYALQVIARLQLNGAGGLCPFPPLSSINRASSPRNASFHRKIMAFKNRHAPRNLIIYRGFRLYQCGQRDF